MPPPSNPSPIGSAPEVGNTNPVELSLSGAYPLPEQITEGLRDIEPKILGSAVSIDKVDEVTAIRFGKISADPNFKNRKGEVSRVGDNLKFCYVGSYLNNPPIYVPIIQQVFNFMQSNVAAGQTNVALDVLGLAGNTGYTMAYYGSVIGVSIKSNAAGSGGSLTVEPTIDGAGTGLTATITSSSANSKTQEADNDIFARTFVTNALLGCRITTTGAWAPTTADIVVSVYIM